MTSRQDMIDHDGVCRTVTGKVNDDLCVSCRWEDRKRTRESQPVECIRTWKVETTSTGVVLTINGIRFSTTSGESIAFGLARAARGHNAPADADEHSEGEVR